MTTQQTMSKEIAEAELELKAKLYNSIKVDKIKQFVDRHYGFLIERNTREDEYVQARTMYYFLSRSYTSTILADIGALLNRDHSTVVHSLKNNHHFYLKHNQNYKNGVAAFNDYLIRYVGVLENEQPSEGRFELAAIKESVLYYENKKLKEELRQLSKEHTILLYSQEVSSVLGDLINKIPKDKLSIVEERLAAMIKML